MRQLTQIFSLIIFLMATLSSGHASPALEPPTPVELEYVKGYNVVESGRDFFRIEIGFKGDEQTMLIDLKNTIPGKVGRRAGMDIEYVEPAESLTVKEIERGHTQLQLAFDKSIDDRSFRTHIEKANKSQKQPTRLMIDIDNYIFIEEEVSDYEIGSGAIVIDPGHGGSDSGAIGSSGVALKVKEFLEEQGDPVIMTRTTDRDVHSPQATNAQELQARVSKAPRDAAIFVSIHCNAFSNPSSHGMETYYYTGSGRGRRLAKLINEELEHYGGLFNRGVKSANFYVLKHSSIPATLLELAFVTNPEEEQLLADEDYQTSLARAIVEGINRYFGRTD